MQIDQMYELYYPKIYHYVYYRLMNRERTEDIVSSVFVKVVAGWNSFDESKASFSTWIYTITQNTLTDYYRMNKPMASTEEMEYEGRVEFEGEEQLIREETNKEVYRLLKTLNEAERELVFLRFYEKMKNKQIADMLGMTETAVSTKMSRIMHKLRSSMRPEDFAELKSSESQV